jgi:hypothetical protein
MSARAVPLAAAALLVLLGVLYIVKRTSGDPFDLAEWYSDGNCMWCRQPLRPDQLVGGYNEAPSYGLAHVVCIEAADCPPWEIGL